MKVVVFAYHDIGYTGIQRLIAAGFDVQAVFTQADDPRENTFFASVAQLCAENGIPAYACLLYTSPSPRDLSTSRMPSSA